MTRCTGKVRQKIEYLWIEMVDLTGSVVPQKPIQLRQRTRSKDRRWRTPENVSWELLLSVQRLRVGDIAQPSQVSAVGKAWTRDCTEEFRRRRGNDQLTAMYRTPGQPPHPLYAYPPCERVSRTRGRR